MELRSIKIISIKLNLCLCVNMNHSRILRSVTIILLLIITLCQISPVKAVEYSETGYLAEKTLPATVLVYSVLEYEATVYVPWTTGTEEYTVTNSLSAIGSGFFVNPQGYIITNGHVVFCFESNNYKDDSITKYEILKDATGVLIPYVEQWEGYALTQEDIQVTLDYNLENGVVDSTHRSEYIVLGDAQGNIIEAKLGYGATVVTADPFLGRDLALLKVELTNTPSLLIVEDAEDVSVGDEVFALGYPGVATFHPLLSEDTLLVPTFTMGIVSAKRLTAKHISAIQHNAEVTHGNSGGPLVNRDGKVVGANNMGSITDLGIEVAGFNFAIACNVILDFLRENGVENSLGTTTTEYEEGLACYYAKMYGSAKKQFQDVQALFPYHWRAQQLAQECQSKISKGEMAESDISLTVSSTEVTVDKDLITVSGKLSHLLEMPIPVEVNWPNPAISIEYTKPDGTKLTKTVMASKEGTFEDSFTPNVDGEWGITASWEGTEDHKEATSQSVTLTVLKSAGGGIPGFPYESILLGIVAGVIILWLLQKKV